VFFVRRFTADNFLRRLSLPDAVDNQSPDSTIRNLLFRSLLVGHRSYLIYICMHLISVAFRYIRYTLHQYHTPLSVSSLGDSHRLPQRVLFLRAPLHNASNSLYQFQSPLSMMQHERIHV
jgi:hypothetical protein